MIDDGRTFSTCFDTWAECRESMLGDWTNGNDALFKSSSSATINAHNCNTREGSEDGEKSGGNCSWSFADDKRSVYARDGRRVGSTTS